MVDSIPASKYVTDTVGLIFRIEGRTLGTGARSAFGSADAGTSVIHVPAMVLAEVLYLSERRRIRVSLGDVASFLQQNPNCREEPMTLATLQAAAEITDVPELHDRLIAGVARMLGVQLITNDPVIRASAFVQTVW